MRPGETATRPTAPPASPARRPAIASPRTAGQTPSTARAPARSSAADTSSRGSQDSSAGCSTAGNDAVYPVASTAATNSSRVTVSGKAIEACSVAKLTVACTPSIRLSRFSIRAAHDAQVMPPTARVTVLMPRRRRRIRRPRSRPITCAASGVPSTRTVPPPHVDVDSGHPGQRRHGRRNGRDAMSATHSANFHDHAHVIESIPTGGICYVPCVTRSGSERPRRAGR